MSTFITFHATPAYVVLQGASYVEVMLPPHD